MENTNTENINVSPVKSGNRGRKPFVYAIKKRCNPDLKRPVFTLLGKQPTWTLVDTAKDMSQKGNKYYTFPTEAEYEAKIKAIRKSGDPILENA